MAMPMACRRAVAMAPGGFIAIGSSTSTSSSTSKSTLSGPSLLQDADLSCSEAWEKEADSPIKAALPRRQQQQQAPQLQSLQVANRTPPRRLRPRPSAVSFKHDGCSKGLRREEKLEVLGNMLRAQAKFHPRTTATEAGAGGERRERAMCHEVSPFVAERRRWFVAWKNQMASFLGYSRDTVAVALNYFDRYTCARPCSPTLAQAAAATALHVAAKFEESNPASLRQLLKFTPVFTPDQLMVIEMSMLKVLNWDLRPVTIYDFVRSFCDLMSTRTGSTPKTRQGRGDEKELRIGAEEIADLCASEVSLLEFYPSTLAMSAVLLSASRPEAVTSHADVLDACVTAVGVSNNLISLERILDCIRLVGASLAKRLPAAGAAADIAAEQVIRYAALDVEAEVDVARDLAAVETTMSSGRGSGSPVPPAKKRRCSTPTSVDGIVHIEMAGMLDATAASGDNDGAGAIGVGSNASLACSRSSAVMTSSGGGGGEQSSNVAVAAREKGSRRSANPHRPTPYAAPSAHGVMASTAAALGARAFSFSDDEVILAQGAKRGVVSSVFIAAPENTPWQPQQLSSRRLPSSSSSVCSMGSRKRSAEALGHCESGSGFGAPMPRCGGGKAASSTSAPAAAAVVDLVRGGRSGGL